MEPEKGRQVKKIKVRLVPPERRDLPITTPFIKLDSALKLADIAGSGGMAKLLIEDEQIRVNGEVCTQRGKKLYPGDSFRFENTDYVITEKE
ncbi:MAG: RNA-binding S4 domain-containing protein [Clostridia bacterium]|nr:RNA-binding S4 domain-containing protein [Clostridia bacterium]